jgi:hypothetical protein
MEVMIVEINPSEEVLKPCPFCGFQPDRNDPDCIYPAISPVYDAEESQMIFKVWNINCYESGGGCSAHILGSSAEDCIKKWNTRTFPVLEVRKLQPWASRASRHASKEMQNWRNMALIDTLKTNGVLSQEYDATE